MASSGNLNRYAPLPADTVREGQDAFTLMVRAEAAMRTPHTPSTPYAVDVAEYAADPAHHQMA